MGCRLVQHKRAVEWNRKHLHTDPVLVHLLEATFYIDHTRIGSHPPDQALCILARRRVVISEDALKAINVSGLKKMSMHIDFHEAPPTIALIFVVCINCPLSWSKAFNYLITRS